jgi:hypothetical protein
LDFVFLGFEKIQTNESECLYHTYLIYII